MLFSWLDPVKSKILVNISKWESTKFYKFWVQESCGILSKFKIDLLISDLWTNYKNLIYQCEKLDV